MEERPRLILLLFGGIPNSPCVENVVLSLNAIGMPGGAEDNRGR